MKRAQFSHVHPLNSFLSQNASHPMNVRSHTMSSFDSSSPKRKPSDDWMEELANMRHKFRQKRRERVERDIERGREHVSKVGDIVSDVFRIVVDSVDTALDAAQQANQQQRLKNQMTAVERYREQSYKQLVRKLDTTERKLERKRKTIAVTGIFASIFTTVSVFADGDFVVPAIVFAGLTALNIFNMRELRTKLFRLHAEHQQFLALAADTTTAVAPANAIAIEKTVLRYANEHQGRVYPERVVIDSEFSLAEIEAYLKMAMEKRICELEVDGNGRTYYYFSSLDSSDPYTNLGGQA
jgi:hypothetical protein